MSNDSTRLPPLEKRHIKVKDLDWPVVIFIALTHVGCAFAFMPQFFTWSGLLVAAVLTWMTAGLGITLCYHRLLTHRSFKTPKWFEYFLTLLGCLTWQGGPIQWVGVHRIHHHHSDEEEDPHTPRHGFSWAHMFWCMHKHPEGQNAQDAARDLARDPVFRVMEKFFWLPQFILAGVLFGVGHALVDNGLSWVFWGLFVRTVVVYHGTWFVNSASHTWGYRNYATTDNSTNLWWVAMLSFGEGWHNNHHAYQRSAAHGLRWFEIDPTYWMIRALSCVGLASEIILPKPDQMPHRQPRPHHETPAPVLKGKAPSLRS